ncbi:hypothetical protein FACS1894102_2670 [Spirochaetia bacterium]|nr:hypothetical protein FACS1894102_2670 [Spirochaetia bacterium]
MNNFPRNYVLRIGDKIKVPGIGTNGTPNMAAREPIITRGNTGTAAKPGTAKRAFDYSVTWPVQVRDASYMTGKLSGVVLTAGRSESVKSVTTGTVISAGPYRGYGRVAIVQTADAYIYIYAGCESLSVKAGDRVVPGSEVGRVGIDALSGKPQVSFMVYRNQSPVDPAKAPRN